MHGLREPHISLPDRLSGPYLAYAEMPTTGDLKPGECLFFTTPPPPEKLTQPPMGMT